MPAPPASLRRLCFVLLLASAPVGAQTTVVQKPNVRVEYAQVLHVEPVYQTLRAQGVEERCEPQHESALKRPSDCRTVRVERQFQRPIAYDVDYIHHGVKYRSRLPFDPGKRLRLKISVVPDVDANGAH